VQERTALFLENIGVRNSEFSIACEMRKNPGKRQLSAPHHQETTCRALGAILDRIGNKWTIMVVGILAKGPMRFNAIMRTLPGLSHRMLTLTLRALERDGLVKRTPYATIPPRVDYELTPIGHSLIKPLAKLAAWANANQSKIETARMRTAIGRPSMISGGVGHED